MAMTARAMATTTRLEGKQQHPMARVTGMVQANVGQKRLKRNNLRRYFIGHKVGFFHLSGA
jgi:hypothetical protein